MLLLLGIALFLAFGGGPGIGPVRWLVVAAAGIVAALPPVARRFESGLVRVRRITAQRPGACVLLVGVLAAAYFALTAVLQQRDLFPKTNDDSSYCLGIQMLAHGRLWMPALPLPDFFQSFYILTRPAYCSIYFPGTALMFVPTVWLHLPTWVLPVAASGAATALLYAITAELIDGAAGALAALLLASLTWFRSYTILLMSQVPMLLLGLLMIWCWMRWRRNQSYRWALVLGALSGWAAITRPVDALCFAIPVGIALVADLLGRPARRVATTVGLIGIGAMPFLALQITFDVGVTGHAFRTPYTLYLDRQVPGSTFGFHAFDPAAAPESILPQIRADYRLTQTYLVLHQPGKFLEPWFWPQRPPGFAPRPAYLSMIAACTLPTTILLVLLPVGLFELNDRRRWVVIGPFPVFLLLYVLNPFFLEHYAIPIIPAVVVCLLLGVQRLRRAWPRTLGPSSAATAVIVTAALTGFWEINHWIVRDPSRQVADELLPSPLLAQAHEVLRGEKAVVLFRWRAGQNWKEEPVYNSEVIWPDDAEVVRAHDLGPRDSEIVNYYARLQPDREFFVWDLKTNVLRRIGTAGELRDAERQGKSLDALLHPGS